MSATTGGDSGGGNDGCGCRDVGGCSAPRMAAVGPTGTVGHSRGAVIARLSFEAAES